MRRGAAGSSEGTALHVVGRIVPNVLRRKKNNRNVSDGKSHASEA